MISSPPNNPETHGSPGGINIISLRAAIFCIAEVNGKIARHIHEEGASTIPYVMMMDALMQVSIVLDVDFKKAVEMKILRNEENYSVYQGHHIGNRAKLTTDHEDWVNAVGEVLSETTWENPLLVPGVAFQFMEWVREKLQQSKKFVSDRGWSKHDTVGNLFASVLVETGEMVEPLQFVDEQSNSVTISMMGSLASEMADVFLYFIRLCDNIGMMDEMEDTILDRAARAQGIADTILDWAV